MEEGKMKFTVARKVVQAYSDKSDKQRIATLLFMEHSKVRNLCRE
jgi:hypothetical protein